MAIAELKRSFLVVLLLALPLAAQSQTSQGKSSGDQNKNKRLWVLRAPGEAVEYDCATFSEKATVKVPAEALVSLNNFSANHLGQMLFVTPATVEEGSPVVDGKAWVWDGHASNTIAVGVKTSTSKTGSNLATTETDLAPSLSADGKHLFWFSHQMRRLHRDAVDLSLQATWSAWQTDLAGAGREDVASITLPECPCPTGSCEESCPYGAVWVPDEGVNNFFLVNLFVAGQVQVAYKATSVYQESAGKWNARTLDPPLKNVLDAANADAILEAIPDTGCCGWANESDDQTMLHLAGKTLSVFDERSEYQNPNYDVSFQTQNGKLSPNIKTVALTVTATAQPNAPIQISEDGQANPEEAQRIRKALLDLPAVEVKSLDGKASETPKRIVFLPHTTLVGWISDREILIVEGNLLVAYDMSSGKRRRSNIRVQDAAHVFLR
jgi:hypothetical protein